jgi:predicted O-methyltransferase YrrM
MKGCATSLKPQMSDAEQSLLLGLLKSGKARGPHLEVGTAAGGTLCAMMRCYSDAERPRFAVVDRMTYFVDQLATVKSNLTAHELDPSTVDFRVNSSTTAFSQAEKQGDRFDFILIDAGHKVMDVLRDLRWARLLNVGGILCLHDYDRSLAHRGVLVAVDRFLSRCPNYERVGYADSLLAVKKKEAGPLEISAADLAYGALVWLPLRITRTWAKTGKRIRRAFSSSKDSKESSQTPQD